MDFAIRTPRLEDTAGLARAAQTRYRGQGIEGRLLGAVEFYEQHGYTQQAVVLRKPLG